MGMTEMKRTAIAAISTAFVATASAVAIICAGGAAQGHGLAGARAVPAAVSPATAQPTSDGDPGGW